MITVYPNRKHSFDLLLTARTPISHHDPSDGTDNNINVFNRALQMIDAGSADFDLKQHHLDKIAVNFPVPKDLEAVILSLSSVEYVAIALVKLAITMYNSKDGTGLFTGQTRYAMLQGRIGSSATRTTTIREFWSVLCKDMLFDIAPMSYDGVLIKFFSLPIGFQRLVIGYLAREYQIATTIARGWNTSLKDDEGTLVDIPVKLQHVDSNAPILANVPAISTNSVRHQLIREPLWWHLVEATGILESLNDDNMVIVPQNAEALFVNGGNIGTNTKKGTNSMLIRKTYPSLALLGGMTDGADLGEGLLQVQSWLVCKENAGRIGRFDGLPQARISAFDMMDITTHTRHETNRGVGQMIFNGEALVPDTVVYVRLDMHPRSNDLELSCLVTAVEEFGKHAYIGGQSARGYGFMDVSWGSEHPTSDLYRQYIQENAQRLADGLVDGTLCTGVRVCN